MQAGKLERRVTIQRFTETRDEMNEPVKVWADVATVWAQARPNRGNERFAAAQVAGAAVMSFHIRYRADLTVQDRLVYDGVVYEIVAPPRELGRRVVTEIDTVAAVD
ncbi:MAG: head-tail adaptor protein [Brevundimonas sp.]|uniref:phage head closure protein n=1 Tax=Brevundimonas sp. TaxID=1871086 RepID=UPI001212550E|nr:phage head closure protein [Brevundimonas sp.]RZJ19120.1 MAG: head-tail adaptor protein [Brevundimonas sp.]